MRHRSYVPVTYKGMQERDLPMLIFDILETHYGEWFTEAQITEQVLLIRPDAKPNTVHRAVQRMVHRTNAVVEVRYTRHTKRTMLQLRVPTRDYWEPHEETHHHNGDRRNGVPTPHLITGRPLRGDGGGQHDDAELRAECG